MRILLDEGVPRPLRKHLMDHTIWSVQEIGWAGSRSGELVNLAEPDFDLILSTDQNVPFRDNLRGRDIALIILVTRDIRHRSLLPFVEEIERTGLNTLPGECRIIT